MRNDYQNPILSEDLDLDFEDEFIADAEVLVKELSSTSPSSSSAKEEVENLLQSSVLLTSKVMKKACDYHRKNPYRCMATAAITGLALGLLLTRRS
jgi:ElaB/YqjD/DUF883 family membrane-anchored ribosome-binding protein